MITNLRKNIFANYLGKIWGLISVYIFIPVYIKLLGIESYAVINFYSVLLIIMFFADAGLSATLNREIARIDDNKYLRTLLFTIERLYLGISIIIVILICSMSGFLSKNWLKSETISEENISFYIKLMGGCISLQLSTTLYNSGLMGLQKQVLSNTIQILWSATRSGLVILPLLFMPTLTTFFLWQLIVNLFFFFLTRYYLWKNIPSNNMPVFDFQIIKTVGKFALGMMMMSIISSLNSQIDKLVISKMLSLTQFGYYSLASVLGQSPLIFITPIAIAILPIMTKLSEEKNKFELINIFHKNSFIIATVACTLSMILFLYTKDFVIIWTHNLGIAQNINNVSKVLLIGGTFLAFQYMPYYLAIANGHTKTNVRLGIIVVICIIPGLFFFVEKYGLIGASFPWLLLNILSTFYLGYFIIKKFLVGEFKRWVFQDTLLPLFITSSIGAIIYFITKELPKGYFVLFYSIIAGIISLFINWAIYNQINNTNKIKIGFAVES